MSQPERIYPPPPIDGYRSLTQGECDAINAIKAIAKSVGFTVDNAERMDGVDQRWIETARTQLQLGFMSLVRAVARPTNF